jgi:hypothetical protein
MAALGGRFAAIFAKKRKLPLGAFSFVFLQTGRRLSSG